MLCPSGSRCLIHILACIHGRDLHDTREDNYRYHHHKLHSDHMVMDYKDFVRAMLELKGNSIIVKNSLMEEESYLVTLWYKV